MSARWAMRLDLGYAPSAGGLRLHAGIEALVTGEGFWLRGGEMSEVLRAAIVCIPGERFELAGEALTPVGALLPIGQLPAGQWRPLREVLAVALPVAAWPAEAPGRIPLRLVRTDVERPATVLRTTAAALLDFASGAAAIRLRSLSFALATDAALLRGTPLPALAGMRYAETAGIAVPCGFALAPIGDPEVLARVLGLGAGDMAIFAEAGGYELIPAEAFVGLTRSAVRASLRPLISERPPVLGLGGGR